MTELATRFGRLFHHLPAPPRPVRDLVFDGTPFLQRMAGDQMPAPILSQLRQIDD